MEAEKLSDSFFPGSNGDEPILTKNDSGSASPAGKKKLFILVIVIIILLAGGLIWAITKYQKTNGGASLAAIATVSQQQSTAELLQKVGQHLDLPAGETPQVYVIQDASQLVSQQPFWVGVTNGDVALIYMTARKAVVYSPTRDKIVNVGPIYLSDNPTNQAANISPSAKPAATTDKKIKTQP